MVNKLMYLRYKHNIILKGNEQSYSNMGHTTCDIVWKMNKCLKKNVSNKLIKGYWTLPKQIQLQ